MKKEITKMAKGGMVKMIKFDVYKGFSSIAEVEMAMGALGLYERTYLIIEFLGKYYGVTAPNSTQALVLGENKSWIKEVGLWEGVNTWDVKVPFQVESPTKGLTGSPKIVADLEILDPHYRILNRYKDGWKDVRGSYGYLTYFIELLVRTFHGSYFGQEDIPLLVDYGVASKSCLHRKFSNRRISKVNPFRTEALYVTGKVHRTMF